MARKMQMQENQDLDPNEPGWWNKISDPIRFRECKTCVKRIGEDVQTGLIMPRIGRCPDYPVRLPNREYSNHKKQCGSTQTTKGKSIRLRTQVLTENLYCELDEDEDMDLDDQEMQQVLLCVSTDPRTSRGGRARR
jgi:hypothetical protein